MEITTTTNTTNISSSPLPTFEPITKPIEKRSKSTSPGKNEPIATSPEINQFNKKQYKLPFESTSKFNFQNMFNPTIPTTTTSYNKSTISSFPTKSVMEIIRSQENRNNAIIMNESNTKQPEITNIELNKNTSLITDIDRIPKNLKKYIIRYPTSTEKQMLKYLMELDYPEYKYICYRLCDIPKVKYRYVTANRLIRQYGKRIQVEIKAFQEFYKEENGKGNDCDQHRPIEERESTIAEAGEL